MEYLSRLNASIDYLEKNIEDKLNIDEVAKMALTSKFHFQRMFHMVTGVSVAEYVRRRRLTLAAQKLATSDVKVIDVALKYGYQTPESFSKAFSKMHGINPSEVRGQGMDLKAYPRLSFHIQIKGEAVMNYRIVEKEGFKVVGQSKLVTTKEGKNFEIIPKFWDEVNSNGVCRELESRVGEMGILGICMDFCHEKDEFTYVVAAEKLNGDVPNHMIEKEIPASTWAVFESIGPMPTAIQDVIKRIYSEWFPATGYEHAGGPELEVYLPGNPNDPNYKCEVWVPINKK
ncbi:AraC family transcriptional regulator [Alkaliphilus hydrothermalis]|uniref:AraC family transcriptional regulator n=1 Tax=Alkaliphilus hydrothermalis TaxID=1482730 RepID=A0ABS2NPT0_9FIRM|nr:AraC family transcriptional regulator [Alkaliphilus hydrothermalis]